MLTPHLSIFVSGRSASEPTEPRPPRGQRQVPLAGFGAGLVELLAAQGGLACGLAGDPECSADLGPGGSLGAGGVDHQICCGVEGVSGVSQPLEVLGGPVRVVARVVIVRATHHRAWVPAVVLIAGS